MSGIRGANTKPEMIVRRGLHARGYRFRLHDRKLRGRPDMVLPRHSAVILIHGCFWHAHDCHLFRWPKSRGLFWREKISGNRERDIENFAALRSEGWRILQIWECALKGRSRLGPEKVVELAAEWLKSGEQAGEIRGTDADD